MYLDPSQVESLELYADEWRAPPAIPELKLQGPNPFVPQDLKVIVPDGKLPKPGEPVPPPTVVETLSADGCGWKVTVDRTLVSPARDDRVEDLPVIDRKQTQ